MCFGSKDQESAPAPRPASIHSTHNPKASYVPPQQPVAATASAGPSTAQNSYAPPAGPPPSHANARDNNDNFAPPAGPPPSHSTANDFAPPTGPPPSHSAANDFAPPSGPPPSHSVTNDYAAPVGPPPSHSATNDYAAPSGPPPSHSVTNNDFAPPSGPPPSHTATNDYAPPSGPPPSHSAAKDYAPPSGPPPSHATDFAAPAGPPPSHHNDAYAPPSGPPPSHDGSHDWQAAVPDTSLLPPPPALFTGWDRSPATNAPEEEAEAGEAWCREHPLSEPPLALPGSDPATANAIARHNIDLVRPPNIFRGDLRQLRPGVWSAKTSSSSKDSSLIGYPPLYAPSLHAPQNTGSSTFTAYYEVYISPQNPREVNLAIGYAALPYPAFRMPGWHRGSLAVHGDDGHKYINDLWGGKSFTQPFKPGDTVGLGLRFAPAKTSASDIDVEIFFTRNGALDGRWNLHEESDAEQDRSVAGLAGFHDLCAAIGSYKEVNFEVRFDPVMWAYRGELLK